MGDIEFLFCFGVIVFFFSLDKTMDDIELLFCFGVIVFFFL